MVSRKFFGLLALAGLATSALLSGCGGSSSSDTVTSIPTSATVFYAHSVAFKNSTSQTLYAWGYNGFGQLGLGDLENRKVAVRVPTPVPVYRVAAGADHTLALALADLSSVYAWGSNNSGQIGQPTITGADAYSSSPVKIPLGGVVTNIAAGGFHSLAVVDGGVRGWGYNAKGQLGDNSFTSRTTPVAVLSTGDTLPITGISAVAAGSTYSLALTSDGRVYAWGNNANGQLATDPTLPSNSSRSTAELVQADGATLTGVIQIAAGGQTSYALQSDGTVWTWGNNNYQPVKISFALLGTAARKVEQISAGWTHALARMDDGTIASWGYNDKGQLGNNDSGTTPVTVPVRVLAGGSAVAGTVMAGVTDIIAFGDHSLARSNGVWYGWGNNGNGQLGRPISTSGEGFFRVPAPVLGL